MKIPMAVFRSALTINVERNRSTAFLAFSNATTNAVHHKAPSNVYTILDLQHLAQRKLRQETSLPRHRLVGLATNSSGLEYSNIGRFDRTINRFAFRNASSSATVSPMDIADRPMTVKERVLTFPNNVLMLWKDWLLYRNIRDAAATKRNAWSEDAHGLQLATGLQHSRELHVATSTRLEAPSSGIGSIPWRQREQQRRFLDGLSTVLPTVILWLLPIIGYIPMFLAIAAPRQLLSRHFFNQFEILEFNRLTYQQRHAHFHSVQRHFANSASDGKPTIDSLCMDTNKGVWSGQDVGGPLPVTLQPFQEWFAAFTSKVAAKEQRRDSEDPLSRPLLVELALAFGLYPTIPPPWNARLAHWSPTWWLQRHIQSLSLLIAQDDRLLLSFARKGEKAGALLDASLPMLTDIEVMDACLLRGLPIGTFVTFEEMRLCLSNHLRMMETLVLVPDDHGTNNVQSRWSDEATGLFTLSLVIVRDYAKQQSL